MAVTLDWLGQYFPPPQVWKVGVEGAEWSVLPGASMILQERRPVLICEVSTQSSVPMADLLGSFHYAIDDGSAKAGDRRRLESCPWSTIAIPAEREIGDGLPPVQQTSGDQCT